MAPITAPAPDLGACVTTASFVQTWRGTATCCTTGVLEMTRARMSMAEAGAAPRAAAVAAAPMNVLTSMLFMSWPLFSNALRKPDRCGKPPARAGHFPILVTGSRFKARSSVAGL
jgi:hypothetical protein